MRPKPPRYRKIRREIITDDRPKTQTLDNKKGDYKIVTFYLRFLMRSALGLVQGERAQLTPVNEHVRHRSWAKEQAIKSLVFEHR